MTYIDPFAEPKDVAKRATIEREKARANEFDLVNFYGSRSTYVGSKAALARMAARAGKPMPPEFIEHGVKPGTAEE